jgi:hypothetical protein
MNRTRGSYALGESGRLLRALQNLAERLGLLGERGSVLECDSFLSLWPVCGKYLTK